MEASHARRNTKKLAGGGGKERREEESGRIASTKGESDDQQCGRQYWVLAQDHKSPQHGEEERRSWRKKKRTSDCWTDVKQRGKTVQNIGNVTKVCSMYRKTEELKNLEKALTRIKERVRFGEGFETAQGKDRRRMGWLSPKSPSVLHHENKCRCGGTLEKSHSDYNLMQDS